MTDRFPVFASHVHELVASFLGLHGHPEARTSMPAAIDAAQASGLNWRAASLGEPPVAKPA